jgi:hypothetical protein
MPICRLADAEAGKTCLNFLVKVGNPLLSQSPADDRVRSKGEASRNFALAERTGRRGRFQLNDFSGFAGAERSEGQRLWIALCGLPFEVARCYLDWRENFSHGGGVYAKAHSTDSSCQCDVDDGRGLEQSR